MIAGVIPSSCRNRAMPYATSGSLVDCNLLLCDLELHIDHCIDEPSSLLSQFIRNRSSREVAHVLEERVKCWQRQSGMNPRSLAPCVHLQEIDPQYCASALIIDVIRPKRFIRNADSQYELNLLGRLSFLAVCQRNSVPLMHMTFLSLALIVQA